MKNITFLQSIEGFYLNTAQILALQPSKDGTKYRATLSKPLKPLQYAGSNGQIWYAWIERKELELKGVLQ